MKTKFEQIIDEFERKLDEEVAKCDGEDCGYLISYYHRSNDNQCDDDLVGKSHCHGKTSILAGPLSRLALTN